MEMVDGAWRDTNVVFASNVARSAGEWDSKRRDVARAG